MSHFGEGGTKGYNTDRPAIDQIADRDGKGTSTVTWGEKSAVLGNDLPVKDHSKPFNLTGDIGKRD